jgi:hypothetical protein
MHTNACKCQSVMLVVCTHLKISLPPSTYGLLKLYSLIMHYTLYIFIYPEAFPTALISVFLVPEPGTFNGLNSVESYTIFDGTSIISVQGRSSCQQEERSVKTQERLHVSST